MKATLIVPAVLAAVALGQPHNHRRQAHNAAHNAAHQHHHDKRKLHTEWNIVTEYVTVTKYVDATTTTTIDPSTATPSEGEDRDAQFYEKPTQAAPAPEVTPAPPAPVEPAPELPKPKAKEQPKPAPYVAPPAPEVQEPEPEVYVAPKPDTSGHGWKSGEMTYYDLGLGACGWNDGGKDETEYIVALSHLVMGLQSNGNPMCNDTVTIQAGKKTLVATVRDKCMGCKADDIDGSKKLFRDLFGGLSGGRLPVKWTFN